MVGQPSNHYNRTHKACLFSVVYVKHTEITLLHKILENVRVKYFKFLKSSNLKWSNKNI